MGWSTTAVLPYPPSGNSLYSEVGNFVVRGSDRVDPRLRDIMQRASARLGLKVEVFSGFRSGSSGQHGAGEAIDVRIIDANGRALENYKSPSTFGAYQQLAHAARQVQQERYPEADRHFRWGGYFSGDASVYGALDLMHFDMGGRGQVNNRMLGGTWESGLNTRQASIWGIKPGFAYDRNAPTDGSVAPVGVSRIANERARDVMIRTIIGEAAGETPIGQAAVAYVMLNRASDKRWSNSVTNVAMQDQQFSAWNKGAGGNDLPYRYKPGDPAYESVARVVDGVLSGQIKDPTNGATHYYAPNGMPGGRAPSWWGAVTSASGTDGITVGNHIFAGKTQMNQIASDVALNGNSHGEAPKIRRVLVSEAVPFGELSDMQQTQVRNGMPIPTRKVWKEEAVPVGRNDPTVQAQLDSEAQKRIANEQQIAETAQAAQQAQQAAAEQAAATQQYRQQQAAQAFTELDLLRNISMQASSDMTTSIADWLNSGGPRTGYAQPGELDALLNDIPGMG